MPIPPLPLFRHRDTVVTPADQNQFVTQFENTMDTMSNSVIPAINDAITDINSKVTTATTARDEAVTAKNIAVSAKDEAVTAVATLTAGAIDNTTIAPNKAFSNQFITNNYYKKTETYSKTEIDNKTNINGFDNKPTPINTDNFVLQEVGGDLKKVSYKNLFDKVSITGSATFNGTTQTIDLTGIGNITLAIGDVIEVSGTTSNNKLFTVESIPSVNQIVVNYEHRGTSAPVPSKRLINETANTTIKLYNRAKNAPIGQGQGWCIPASGRTNGVNYLNNTNREIQIWANIPNIDNFVTTTGNIGFEIDNVPEAIIMNSLIVTAGENYKYSKQPLTYRELR